MKKERPDFQKKVTLVCGDVAEPELGLCELDKERVKSEVTVVIHGAATVRFDETLKVAVAINIFGTQQVLKLCHSAPKLKAFIHISTAYANCQIKEIEERIYAPPIDGDKMIQLTECLPEQIINKCTEDIINGWPNTYAFTKQVAEDVVRMYGKSLPSVIFRPAIVVGSCAEPVPGWIDNVYGPTGVVVGAGSGLMRTLHADKKVVANLVPVDLTINAVLAATSQLIKSGAQEEIPVYNFVSSRLTWGDFLKYYLKHGIDVPSVKAVYYYTMTVTTNRLFYLLMVLFLHLIPAVIVDGILIATAHKPQALKIYQKIYKFSTVISYFANNQWKFHNDRVKSLWSKMSDGDRKDFNFDMESVNWDKFAQDNVRGIRIYLFKDTPDTIPTGKRKMFW
ncbi:fatty acyl-CoA reductase wat [Nilaparvata lugens]|uniref:fatty acyl-CoA reductase wat n=1 Tax=Nilaparvata lugens TaxID=108931 RepID=UPI00193CBE41|nr:fatty acyl-CoA reductase wat [Nilaparvata lugens]